MNQQGTLYLIPNTLGDTPVDEVIPPLVKAVINTIDEFIVEEIRSARRFLKKAGILKPIDELTFYELNEHTQEEQTAHYLDAISKGRNMGIISEAGCPVLADPGAIIIQAAHKKNIKVIPLTGPSSITLALMASGFNGQSFIFHGYIPKEKSERIKKLKEIEKDAWQKNQTQICIEAPYRNQALLEDILSALRPETQLCIACDITLPQEYIQTKAIAQWKKHIPQINKRPCVFLIYKGF